MSTPSSASSAPTAAASCPRRWCPRSTSSSAPGSPRARDPASTRSCRRCCATTSAARRRSTTPRACPSSVGHPVYLKREDLLHTGSHKINNAIGQTLLARRMGKTRIIAETGAGQHGVATATACALFGLDVRRLHGRRGHPPPEAERRADEAARRRGRRRSRPARARSRRRCPRRSATGSRTSARPTT